MFQHILISEYRRDNILEYTNKIWVNFIHCSVRVRRPRFLTGKNNEFCIYKHRNILGQAQRLLTKSQNFLKNYLTLHDKKVFKMLFGIAF